MKASKTTNRKAASLEEISIISFKYDDLVIRFKRAKSEDTLDLMYKGALKKNRETTNGQGLGNGTNRNRASS